MTWTPLCKWHSEIWWDLSVIHHNDHAGVPLRSSFKRTCCEKGSRWTSSSWHTLALTVAFITKSCSPGLLPTNDRGWSSNNSWADSAQQRFLWCAPVLWAPHCLAEIVLKSEALPTFAWQSESSSYLIYSLPPYTLQLFPSNKSLVFLMPSRHLPFGGPKVTHT